MNNKKTKFISSLIVIICLLFSSIPSDVLAQQAMSSGNYKIQSDSVNFAGNRSTSALYGLESTAGEISTGNISSPSYAAQIGYQAMVFTDIIPPSAPPSISATALTTDRIEINWGESTDNVDVTRYFIYRDGVRIADVATFPRNFVDSGLRENTLYTYNVSAADDAGLESLWSDSATARTFRVGSVSGVRQINLSDLLIIPTDISALVSFKSGASVRTKISWGTNTDYSLGTQINNDLSSTHYLILKDLSPKTLYYLKIQMTRADGHSSTYENIFFSTLSAPNIVLPPNVLNFSATAGEKDIMLDWTMPRDSTLIGVRIVRSKDFYPSTPQDGETIFSGKGVNFVDKGVVAGTKYYYTIFTEDLGGNLSSGVVADAQILLPGQTKESLSVLDTLAIIGDVHPMIAGLEIKDFLFIQDGNSLKVKDNLVTIDGQKNLTVALKSYRVPPVLKTIAVSLIMKEKDKEPKSFTFILRLNRDKTRYEATIGSLGETNTYVLKIVIADFKNQGLKKFQGTMMVFNAPPEFSATRYLNQFFALGIGLIFIILLLLLLKRRLEKIG